MYCQSSGHECKITMIRKQRPFYYASEEQYRWLQIIANKLNPSANINDIQQLKAIAASLGAGDAVVKREETQYSPDADAAGTSPEVAIQVEQEEGMEGVVDGFGTLMLDPLGRQSTIPPKPLNTIPI